MPQLDLATANRIIEAALGKAAEAGMKPVAVAVLGPEGHVISLQRQDGASMFRNEIATGKAWGAVAMGESSRSLGRKARDNPSFVQGLTVTSGGRILTSPGGVLIRGPQGAILGAVGISGDSGPNDEVLGIHGIEAVGLVADAGE